MYRLVCFGSAKKMQKDDHDGTRTHNPQIRSLVRYPLRHEVRKTTRFSVLMSESEAILYLYNIFARLDVTFCPATAVQHKILPLLATSIAQQLWHTMSTSDLRSSLREALSFQPTYRTRKSTHNLPTPYLDRVSVTEHRGSPKDTARNTSRRHPSGLPDSSSYKKLIIRPIGVPDLKHTKLQTCFAPEEVPFTAPTGKILKGLRTTLQRGYIDAVKSVRAEVEATRRKRIEQDKRDAENDGYYDDNRYENEERGDLMQASLFDRGVGESASTSSKSAAEVADSSDKPAYSAPPKFEAFLDFVYGPSNMNGEFPRSHNAQMKEYLPVPRK